MTVVIRNYYCFLVFFSTLFFFYLANCGQNCFKPQPYLKWSSEEPRRDFGPGSVGIQFKDLPDVPGILRELLYLFLIGLLYIALLMIIESGLVQRIKALVIKPDPSIFREHQSLDEDVVLEKERVANMVREGLFEISIIVK